MKSYDHKKIEKKWQGVWDKKKIYNATNAKNGKSKKFYGLIEFPYPSGAGLHVGHIRSNTAMDIISRKRRMEGYNVLYPIGWDAFGLPTENYAIKTGIQPAIVTKQNTDTFRRQLKELGFSFDWSREVDTTDPAYYKWTQWIFLQMFKKGLAYKAKTEINWCPKDKIGLANEEAEGGICDRCGGPVEKREKEQWMLAITKYADRLDKDLDGVNYLEKIKIQQRNWIGKSEGALIKFAGEKDSIEVFTTRPDTIYGVTFIAISGKSDRFTGRYVINPASKELIPVWEAEYVLGDYGTGAIMGVPAHDERDFEFAKKNNLPIKQVIISLENDTINPPKDGLEEVKRNTVIVFLKNKETDKYAILDWHGSLSGIRTGIMGGIEENQTPEDAVLSEIKEEASLEGIKITKKLRWITGAKYCASHKNQNRCAISHVYLAEVNNTKDQGLINDEEKKLHTLIWVDKKDVINKLTPNHQKFIWNQLFNETALLDDGILMNSGKFNDLSSKEAYKEITKFVGAKVVTKFKLRDWVFSRQRYWGEPIPIIHCDVCGYVPVPEKDLPIKLPKVKSYQPTDNGESPLASISKWVNTKCPNCKGKAKRETDTMPNWAGSSWYYLRYVDSKNKKEFASKKALKYWMGNGVDWYNGGMEHTTLHLLYSRFWHKFLYDMKLVPTKEPYMKRTSHGMILAEDGVKMSKSLGNTVDPKDVVKNFGADTLRTYEMFMGPFDQSVNWSTDSIVGPRRFLERVWKLKYKISKNKSFKELEKVLHKTIKKVGEDIEDMRFNTAVSTMMILVGEMEKSENIAINDYKKFLQILAPFAPHITEELWRELGEKKTIHHSLWPKFDESKIIDNELKIIVQVNGKVRGEIFVLTDSTEEDIKTKALDLESVRNYTKGQVVKKVIYVKGRLINIVI